jgi:hemolysin-activating ACP:hemolysin acyltransferase
MFMWRKLVFDEAVFDSLLHFVDTFQFCMKSDNNNGPFFCSWAQVEYK